MGHRERSTTNREYMLTFLTRRQRLALGQRLENHIKECAYWEDVFRCVIPVINPLAERGIAFRGTEERFGSLQNDSFFRAASANKRYNWMQQRILKKISFPYMCSVQPIA